MDSPRPIQSVFGIIDPKNAPGGENLGFLNYGSGGEGLGHFLTALINLLFIVAGIFLILMFLWGAWDWIISGGEKEKVANARNKLIHAVIGFILFAIAFAIIGLLGQFLGFKFFTPNS